MGFKTVSLSDCKVNSNLSLLCPEPYQYAIHDFSLKSWSQQLIIKHFQWHHSSQGWDHESIAIRYCCLAASARCENSGLALIIEEWVMQEMKGNQVKHQPGRALMSPEKCPETGANFNLGGPLWSEPLHDASFVADLLRSIRVRQFMRSLSEEPLASCSY